MSNHTTQLLTVSEIGAELSLGQSTIWRKVKDGSFPPPIKIGGATRWHLIEVESYIAKLTDEQRKAAGDAGQ